MKQATRQNYEITSLEDKPEYYNQALELITRELNYPQDQSFAIDFYPLFNRSNAKNLYVLIRDKKVLAHIGLKKRKLSYLNFQYSVALLGGICVEKKEQCSGLFTILFDYVKKKHDHEFLFYFLWSDLSSFYEKFNFVEFGLIREAGIKPYEHQPIEGFSSCNLSNCDKKTSDEIKLLYKEMNQSFLHLERSQEDWEEIKKITSASFYYHPGRDYYIAHKGADLKGIIHESTISHLGEYLSWQPTTNIHSTDKLRYMGFISVANKKIFEKFIFECTQGRLRILNLDDEKVKILLDDKEYQLGYKTFLQGIFGPSYIEELENLLPPIVVYGLDSV